MGIGAAIASFIGGLATSITAGAVALGVGEATAGIVASIAAPALVGAGVGAAGSLITGGNPLTGALTGGLTGGLLGGLGGASGALTSAFGGSQVASGGVLGALGGAAGYGLTGQDPLKGALFGGAGGALTGGINQFGQGGTESLGNLGGTSNTVSGVGNLPNNSPGSAFGNGVVSDAAGGVPITQGSPVPSTYGATSTFATDNLNPQSALAASGGSAASKSGFGSIIDKISNNPSLALGALSAVSSLLNKPQQATSASAGPSSVAANAGNFYQPLKPVGTYPGSTAVTPDNVPNYYTYGSIPGGANFFKNNSLAAYGFAKGGALQREYVPNDRNRHVKGPGTETSDSIPALLSRNEYVLDANDVRRIGGGSNARGAKILDRERKKLTRNNGGALSRLSEAA